MKQTVIHIPSFQGPYKTGLVFSMIEGLKEGEGFQMICDQPPVELEHLMSEARLKNMTWTSRQISEGKWEISVQKKASSEEQVGCCGMCGLHRGSEETP